MKDRNNVSVIKHSYAPKEERAYKPNGSRSPSPTPNPNPSYKPPALIKKEK